MMWTGFYLRRKTCIHKKCGLENFLHKKWDFSFSECGFSRFTLLSSPLLCRFDIWLVLFVFLMDQFRVCQYLNKRAVTIEDSRESCCFLQKPQMSVQISDVVWSKLIKTNRLCSTRAIAITHERTYIRWQSRWPDGYLAWLISIWKSIYYFRNFLAIQQFQN